MDGESVLVACRADGESVVVAFRMVAPCKETPPQANLSPVPALEWPQEAQAIVSPLAREMLASVACQSPQVTHRPSKLADATVVPGQTLG